MEDQTLKQAWEAANKYHGFGDEKLTGFLQKTYQKSIVDLRKKIKLDYIISLIISLLLITTLFIADLKYKWVATLIISGFSGLSFIHFKIRELMIFAIPAEDEGILDAIDKQLRAFRNYRNSCRFGIPLFTVILALTYSRFYLAPLNNSDLLFALGSGIFSILLVEFVWQIIYSGPLEKMQRLRRIQKRLHQ